MRMFEHHGPRSHKFWAIEVHGDSFTITFGKVGTSGQTRTKSFATDEKARAAADRLIREKTAKGYVETTPLVPTKQALAFERALAENPDDRGAWSAYADYLDEQGEPRGQFMQVQIALEDEGKSREERKRLTAREGELLREHERDWLGGLAPHLLDRPAEDERRPATEHRWRHGVLSELKVECLTVRLAQALRDAPAARFLEKLHVVSNADYLGIEDETTPRRFPRPRGYSCCEEWLELQGAPLLRSLRVFQMGDIDGEPPEEGWMDNHTYAPGIECLIAEMSRIEELHLLCKEYDRAALFALPNLKNLRVLRMVALGQPYDFDRYHIELDILASNPVLGKLTHLMLHPHYDSEASFIPLSRVAPLFHSPYLKSLVHLQLRLSDMGDEGVREIVASGILERLKWLDLRHGCISDEGARLFAACPDARRLDRLDLSHNAVSAAGLKALRKAGVKAVANNPLTEDELASRQYLREGDFE